MIPEIEGLDLFVLGGGGILYDRDAGEYMREVFIVNELNVPVILYAISADPLTREAARRAVRDALNVSPPPVITVRDRLGYRLPEDVGVTPEIHLTADPAFLLDPHPIHSGCKTKPCLGEQHCPKRRLKPSSQGDHTAVDAIRKVLDEHPHLGVAPGRTACSFPAISDDQTAVPRRPSYD